MTHSKSLADAQYQRWVRTQITDQVVRLRWGPDVAAERLNTPTVLFATATTAQLEALLDRLVAVPPPTAEAAPC